MQSGQNQCAHCMPMIVGGPGVDKPALGGGNIYSMSIYGGFALHQASLRHSLADHVLQETQLEREKLGFLPSPTQERGGGPPQPWVREDTHSFVLPSQERVNSDGEELPSLGSPMGGSPPTGFL